MGCMRLCSKCIWTTSSVTLPGHSGATFGTCQSIEAWFSLPFVYRSHPKKGCRRMHRKRPIGVLMNDEETTCSVGNRLHFVKCHNLDKMRTNTF